MIRGSRQQTSTKLAVDITEHPCRVYHGMVMPKWNMSQSMFKHWGFATVFCNWIFHVDHLHLGLPGRYPVDNAGPIL